MKTFTAKAFEKPTIYLILLVSAAYVSALPIYGAGDHASVTVTITFIDPVKAEVSRDSLNRFLSAEKNKTTEKEDGGESRIVVKSDEPETDRIIVGARGSREESSHVEEAGKYTRGDSIEIYFDPSI